MGMERDIEEIRAGIRAGRFINEASVSQGIVLRLLHALSWQIYDPQVVSPEYTLPGGRVDFALCHPRGKPIAFIEVKKIGQSDGAERQLFEYAFHAGVPMAILTDGQEWHFFLPGEQGDYRERRVYKLDIVERDMAECIARFDRYLRYDTITSGAAINNAKDDYRQEARKREIVAALPITWAKLVADEDDALLEIVAEGVEDHCGLKPDKDTVAEFLKTSVFGDARQTDPRQPGPFGARRQPRPAAPVPPVPVSPPPLANSLPAQASPALPAQASPPPPANQPTPQPVLESIPPPAIGFTLGGRFQRGRNARDVLVKVFEALTERDATFPERFAALPKHGRKRRYLDRNPDALYPGRPDLARDASMQLASGWWIGTNNSRASIARIVAMACAVAGLTFGSELSVHLDEVDPDGDQEGATFPAAEAAPG
jgi:hypothetical protein